MGTSLAFHFIFAALGIGLPLLLIIAEGAWLRTRDERWYRLARTWSKATAVLFAIGAVSGTTISFELGLLWPEFMRHAGAIIGIPFSAEGFAFFVEAIFVGIYLYGWERLSPVAHWLCAFPIAISGALSGAFVVSANAWMNTPAGFHVVNGRAVDIDPLAAMLNPSMPYEIAHTSLAAYVFTGFAVASVYALTALRVSHSCYLNNAIRVGMLVGGLALPLQIVAGDMVARFDAMNEPVKFAALEGQFHSQADAPLRIGGIPDEQAQVTRNALEIPGGLSFLAFGNTHATVRGLDAVPARDRPTTLPIHLSFQSMVASGFTLLALAVWYTVSTCAGRRTPGRGLLRALVAAGPLALVAMEAGWMVTEEGRQPWIVHGFLRTSQAVTTAPALDLAFYGFTGLYVLLSVTLVWLLRRIHKADDTDAQVRIPATVASA